MTIKPYPAYQPSGLPWLGPIPAHWKTQRLRHAVQLLVSNVDKLSIEGEEPVRLCNYVDAYKHHLIHPNMNFMRATARPDEIRKFRIRVDDVVITKDSEDWKDIGVPAYVMTEAADLVCGYHLAILRPNQDLISGKYLHWLLQSPSVSIQFNVNANGVTRYGLSHSSIKDVWLLLPPLPEQRAIARYLAHHDALTRRYIRAKQKIVALLNEQKQAIIHRAVMRGLDPNVKLKPSGVEWLGEVPEYWEVTALRHRYSTELGKMLDAKRITGDYLVPYLRNIDVQWGSINTQNHSVMDIAPHEYARYTLQDDDLLICEGGEVGRCAIWKGEIPLCGFQKALHRARPIDSSSDIPKFLYYVMYAAAKFGVFMADGSENTIAHLTGVKLRRSRFAFPLKEEQEAIVVYLDKALAELESAEKKARLQITLLREYRTRLIADVVTGKVDVRDAAVGLPEEVEELETEVVEDEPLDESPEMTDEAEPA